ncbi:hypothetical protein ACPOLB_19925 [Rubrivivax sp. RP6-9]|uniref:hypothetical protein n=1 Tax=Rubrivivax sp. RP6-9 TaxID=3415750 RepID=UPI003CC5AF30
MHTFQCRSCAFVGQFGASYVYELAGKPCPKCKKFGEWQDYKDEMAPTILAREDEKLERLRIDQQQLVVRRDKCQLEFTAAAEARQALESRYERLVKVDAVQAAKLMNDLFKATMRLVTAGNDLEDASAQLKDVDEEIDNLGNRSAVKKDAPVAYANARNVQQTSGKNKLYIGSRQYVSLHARKSPKKKFRILDVPNWSPGLNVSWVEGGIRAKAQFKIKLNQGDQYADIPPKVLQLFQDPANYNADDFFKLCKAQGKGSLLWYDKDGAERPTWTALEIWCLLRAGYTFRFADSKTDGAGRKIVLMPPL